jgi:ribosomal protein S18 acetylase RimI-like enzyme
MAVRPLAELDIPQVADLYWSYMRRREGSAPPAVRSFLRELYFTNPWIDGAMPSLVYEGKGGEIVGFLGTIVRKMSVCGQPIRVAYGGNFVVHPEARSHLAGPRLLGAYMAGNYDVWQTDSANDLSRKLLESLGFRTIPALNIHWGRPLRPSHYGVYAMSRAMRPAVSSSFKFAAKIFCDAADNMAARVSFSPFHQTKSSLHGAELDLETLLHCLVEFREDYSLWPEYDVQSLKWLLSFMERRPARGVLRKVVLRDDNQKIVGWYIYYVKRGAVGEVVQIGGEQKLTKDILSHLFYDAWEQQLIALHGVVDMRRVPQFSDKGCFFTSRGGWTVSRSRQPEVLAILERGNAFLSRLDGEWCLDPGD